MSRITRPLRLPWRRVRGVLCRQAGYHVLFLAGVRRSPPFLVPHHFFLLGGGYRRGPSRDYDGGSVGCPPAAGPSDTAPGASGAASPGARPFVLAPASASAT